MKTDYKSGADQRSVAASLIKTNGINFSFRPTDALTVLYGRPQEQDGTWIGVMLAVFPDPGKPELGRIGVIGAMWLAEEHWLHFDAVGKQIALDAVAAAHGWPSDMSPYCNRWHYLRIHCEPYKHEGGSDGEVQS